MSKKALKPSTYLIPSPVVLVSCRDKGGRGNIITIAWAGVVCSEPPMLSVAIRPSRYSYGMIKDSGEFVVNIPGESQLRLTDQCGVHSGRDVDKFSDFGLTAVTGEKVKAPLIQECPLNLECVVKHSVLLGAHEVFLAEIVHVQVTPDCLNEKGLDISSIRPFTYCSGANEYWGLREPIGTYGFSSKKL